MSITLIFENGTTADYNEESPLSQQIEGAEQVVIKPEGCAEKEEAFLDSLVSYLALRPATSVRISVEKGGGLCGARLARRASSINKQIRLSWAAFKVVEIHSDLERKLDDMIEYMRKCGHA